MKSLGFMLWVVLVSLCTMGFAQTDAHTSPGALVPTEAQKSASQP